jgi:hypothetical protein
MALNDQMRNGITGSTRVVEYLLMNDVHMETSNTGDGDKEVSNTAITESTGRTARSS